MRISDLGGMPDQVYHQLVMEEIAKMQQEVSKDIRFIAKRGTYYHSLLSMLAGHQGVHPNEVIRTLVRNAYRVYFGEVPPR